MGNPVSNDTFLIFSPCRQRRGLMNLLVWFLVACLVSSNTLAAGDPKPGTVLVRKLNLRSGPGRHNPPIATLTKGAKVLVLSYEGEWVRVLYKDQTGFIINRERYLHIDEPEEMIDPPSSGHQRNLRESPTKMVTTTNAEKAVIAELEEIQKALGRARKKVARLSTELKAIESRIRESEGQFRETEQRVERNEQYVASRMAALYKLSWIGKFHVLASADSMFDFFANKRALEQILAHDERVLDRLYADKTRMKAILVKLSAEQNEKQAATADLSNRIDTMNREQARREKLLVEIRSKKSLQLAAMASLQMSTKALDQTVASFSVQSKPPEAGLSPVAEKPFAALKGLLMMPVKGKVVSLFGHYQDSKLKVTHFQSGIDIKADRGEPIRAVYSGKTLFSSWFKGFGNMIIIDHGNHYYSVYAHLEEQFKTKGDPVEAGEVIATVGDSGSLTGAGLHFEIRHHGKPMNPLAWIKKS